MATFFGPEDSGSFDEFFARLLGHGGGASGSFRRIDITELMAEETHRLLADAALDAGELGHAHLDVPHLLRATTRQDSTRELLARAGVDPDVLADAVQRQLPAGREGTRGTGPATLTPQARKTLLDSYQVARSLGASYITPEHVLLAMAADEDSGPGRLLGGGATAQSLADSAGDPTRGTAAGRDGRRPSSTPTLDEFGEDLTARARDGLLDPLVGREDEIDQTIEVLARRTKNNPALIGEPGVGKTAIVEGIATRIAAGAVPGTLRDKRVVQLNLSGMLAGTRYRGDFEERMTKVIDEVARHRDEVIMFIDELHTLVGAGGAEGAVDAGNMLKPRLARGELNVVGATTLEEYRKHIEKDPALERRFQPVLVPEPSVDDTVAVLRGLRERYEEHHQVRFTDAAIEAAARLSDRYVSDRFLPDKAIDLIDQAGARKRLRVAAETPDAHELGQRLERLIRDKDEAVRDERYERASQLRDEITALQAELAETDADTEDAPEVTAADIAEVVSRATGVPVSQLTETEKARLQNLEGELHRRVVGQDDAVEAIARSVRRSRSGMGDPHRPVGSFLFVGPTGVGKTELAKALAETLFGSEDRMVRVDMSEFGERHTVSRLFGAPPGYVGYGESAGELTESVRRRPYSVVLLDEVEKAHPDVFNMLLQVLEDGRLTDGSGRTVDFSNTVVIMTSNVGSDLISTPTGTLGFTSAGHAGTVQDMRDRLLPKLREVFRPEFLNRVDEIVTFGRLQPEQLRVITRMLLEHTERRLSSQDVVGVEFSEQAVAWLAERGHQPEFGARPLRRTIQREVDDRVADLLLDGRLVAGGRLVVGVADGDLTFEVHQPALQPAI